MSNIKLVKELRNKEIEDVCFMVDGYANCPLLISSYNRNIHCLKDETFPIYEADKVWKALNTKIDLDTNEIVED